MSEPHLYIATWKDNSRDPAELQWVAEVVRPELDGDDLTLHTCAWFSTERAARSAARRFLDAYFNAEVLPNGQLLIEDGDQLKFYSLTRLASDFGECFRLNAAEGYQLAAGAESYDCCLDGERSTCECPGFCRHGRCRHLRGLGVILPKLAPATPAVA